MAFDKFKENCAIKMSNGDELQSVMNTKNEHWSRRKIIILLALLASSCSEMPQRKDSVNEAIDTGTDTTNHKDTLAKRKPGIPETSTNSDLVRKYDNMRFKDVTVKKAGDNKYLVQGKGQIFEAAFGWVVEDGHNELNKGHEMTNAGAPEWGDFSFTIEIVNKRPSSKLHLILFETSAMDGSRQHELAIPLQ
jgi:hypothetical protein